MQFAGRTTKELMDAMERRRGFDPNTANFSQAELERQAQLLSEAVRYAWEHAMWPQLVRTVRVQYRDDYEPGTSYNEGEQVLFVNAAGVPEYWEALADGTTAEPGEPAWRRCEDTMVASIPYAKYGIDEVDLDGGIFDANPEMRRDAVALEATRVPCGCAVQLRRGHAFTARPFVRFRPLSPRLTATAWNQAKAYAAGDVVMALDGDCYVATAPNTGKNPVERGDLWFRQAVPAMFEDFAVARACAWYAQEEDGKRREMAYADALLTTLERRMCGQIRERGRAAVRTI